MENFVMRVVAWCVVRVPGLFSQFLTLGPDSLMGRWYESNGLYRFKVGQHIEANQRIKAFGYGLNARGEIVGHISENDVSGKREDLYLVNMERDKTGNYFEWKRTGTTTCTERVQKVERHFKWNIENHFVAVRN